ncbi:ribose 5-phosphate isomerase A [Piedraia hortae CBS 480.64]|uniref:Ribose-5-phosphate isomerase n=1 Tax=Piedraia hortae CBS 480.64 TaxID=1314780 RepID=A0A6A7C2U4_9PEZI|nr:ribose 5-phosphate isomerase A [Piedraia hortae CBS 480.64]
MTTHSSGSKAIDPTEFPPSTSTLPPTAAEPTTLTSPAEARTAEEHPPGTLSLRVERAKRLAAQLAISTHFSSTMSYIGIGSGSTIVYGVDAIKAHLSTHPPPAGHTNYFVPTGWNSRKVIESAGLIPIAFDSLPAGRELDVCFDGADEVDEELNCIKGGGACLFQEKLVACRSRKFVCIADWRKDQKRLLTSWPSVPIEVAPIAYVSVLKELEGLGAKAPKVREHTISKSGPVQTDQSFYIVDAPFARLRNGLDGEGEGEGWDVISLARAIKEINGVLEVGLFCGLNGEEAREKGVPGGQKPVAVYFGTEDGEVYVKTAPERRE